MTVKTRDFGEIDIEESDIIDFPKGIFAFEDVRRFILLSPLGDDTFPMWLQCLDEEELCFIVFNPSEIIKDYAVNIEKADLEAVGGGDNGDEVSFLCIAVIPADYKNATVNLKSPIILNADKKLAVQIIAYETYDIRHPVFSKDDV